MVEVESRWAGANNGQARIDGQEGFVGMEPSTMRCSSTAKVLIETCTVNNWTVWSKQSSNSSRLWLIVIYIPSGLRQATYLYSD